MKRALLLVLVGLLVVPAFGPVAASPAPVSVCPVCDYELESVADSAGIDLEIAESEAHATLHENGTAVWTARIRASDPQSFEELQSNVGLRAAAVETLRFGGPETEIRSAELDGEALLVRYTRPNQVTRDWGVFRYDGLRDAPGAYVFTDLGADRLTVEGPPGTSVARAPGAAIAEDGRVTFTSLPNGGGAFLVFAPGETAFPDAAAFAAVFAPLLPVFARNLLWFVAVPTGLFAGGLLSVSGGVSEWSLPAEYVRPAVSVLAGALLIVPLVEAALDYTVRVPLSPGYHPAVVAGCVGTLLLAWQSPEAVQTVRRALGLAFGAALLGMAVGLLVPLALPGDPVRLDAWGIQQAALCLPVLLTFPVGVAARIGSPVRYRVFVLPVLSAAVLLARQFPVFQPATSTSGFGFVLALIAALTAALASAPVLLLATSGQSGPSSGTP